MKKKATRARGRERKTLRSSARAEFMDSRECLEQEGDEEEVVVKRVQVPLPVEEKPAWSEGLDVIISKKETRTELSADQKDYLERKENAKLTSKQKKRLQVLRERKLKRDTREDLYASLAKNQLSADQSAVMKSSARIGQVDTTKQKLKLALKKVRLGLEADKDVHLFQEVELPE